MTIERLTILKQRAKITQEKQNNVYLLQKIEYLEKDMEVLKERLKKPRLKAIHKTADGEYVMGIGNNTNGSITIKDGLITSITEAS